MADTLTTLNDVRLVAGEPKVEQVAQRFGPKFDLKLKNYEVFVGDVLIGKVEQYLPTFERKPKGSRIVSSRWKTAHPRWIYASPFEKRGDHFRRNRYRDYYETRQRCLEELVRNYNEREALHFELNKDERIVDQGKPFHLSPNFNGNVP